MTSDKRAPRGTLDERLAEARDGVLLDGEKIVAQEIGDQGQAIVLTQSRIILLKAGLAATGKLHAQTSKAYTLREVTSVNLRKGPAGAVIQIAGDTERRPAKGGVPDNVIVFSGARRVKKCEALADKIEHLLGRPVERTEPTPEQQQAFEAPQSDPAPVLRHEETPDKAQQPQAAANEPSADTAEEQSDEFEDAPKEFGPNPNIPKPTKRTPVGAGRALILIGSAALLVGLAITGPLKQPEQTSPPKIDTGKLSRSPSEIRRRYEQVAAYRSRVVETLDPSRSSVRRIQDALRAGSKEAVDSALREDVTDGVWRKVDSLSPPAGLAEAKGQLVSGLFSVRTAIATISGNLNMHDSIDPQTGLDKLAEGQALVDEGVGMIDQVLADLKKELAPKSAK